MGSRLMIETQGITKRYGTVQALAGLDLAVEKGTILALLGPNGAGKTTAARVLTTRTLADAGWAKVAGLNVRTHAAEVRRRIGVASQDVTLDELLTGRQNLVMVGELSGLRRSAAGMRAEELLGRFDLLEASGRLVKHYSGGMRRRLDVAASLMANAPVLFLDEPTTGLDPTSRLGVWEVVRGLVSAGVTVLLTTQYLDEADQLADQVVVVDHGRCIAEGTPADLKRSVGGARLEVTLSTGGHAGVTAALAGLVDGALQVSEDRRRISAPVSSRAGLATAVVRALDAAGITVDDVEVRQPSLDDVFFALTGPGTDAREPVGQASASAGEEASASAGDRALASVGEQALASPGEQALASGRVSPAEREEVAI